MFGHQKITSTPTSPPLYCVLPIPSLSLSPLPYFSICLILARPLTHKSNTGHLNTICLLPMESGMGWRERRGGSMAAPTVSPLTCFSIHLPIASSSTSSLPLLVLVWFQTQWGVDQGTKCWHSFSYQMLASIRLIPVKEAFTGLDTAK